MNFSFCEQKAPRHIEETDMSAVIPVQESPDAKICRICLDSHVATETNPILQPCNCKGSIAYVHSSCLKRALLIMEKDYDDGFCCEICGEEYKMKVSIKYRPYCGDFSKDRLDSFGNMVIFTTLAIGLIHLIVVGGLEFLNEINTLPNDKAKIFLLGVSFAFFFITLFRLAYIIFYLIQESFWIIETSWKIYNRDDVVQKDSNLKWKLSKLLSVEKSQNL